MKAEDLNGEDISALDNLSAKESFEYLKLLNDLLKTNVNKKERRKAVSEPDGIFRIDDAETLKKLADVYEKGASMGLSTGMLQVDPYYLHYRGNVEIVSGYMNYGKSTWKMYLDMMQAVKYGHKFAWFPPENMGAERFFDNLICMYTGKQSNPKYQTNRMSSSERQEAIAFIKNHFTVVYPPTVSDGVFIDSPHTIDKLEERFQYLVDTEKCDGVRIDPFNQVNVDQHTRDDKLISEFLTRAKLFAVRNDVFYAIMMHPKMADPTQFIKSENDEVAENLKSPNISRIAGGAMTGNKSDQVTVYHRPLRNSDPANPQIQFTTEKSKEFKLMGETGTTDQIQFNFKTNRFEEIRSGVFIDPLEIEIENMKRRRAGKQEVIVEDNGMTDNPQDVDFNNAPF